MDSLKLFFEASHRLGHRIRINGVYQSHAQRLDAGEFFCRYEHFKGASFAKEARQTLGASPSCIRACPILENS